MTKKASPSDKRRSVAVNEESNSPEQQPQGGDQRADNARVDAKSGSQTKSKVASRRKSKTANRKTTKPDQHGVETRFPIVGVGASAGGLETFTELLKRIPANTGMAFVLIQHLDPKHKSMLSELLGRATAMPVIEATDQLAVQPNHIYVIPPDTNLGILHGVLQLMPRGTERKQHLPIDYFMRSLAQDGGPHAIGVILSGTASDGALGLKDIKAEGGITLAQDPSTAKYDGMPRSAIAIGCVDFVLPVKGIAHELGRIAGHPLVARAEIREQVKSVQSADEMNKVFLLLRSRTGNDFTHYKHSTIERRVKRRMLLHKLERLRDYVRLLQQSGAEVEELFQDILINVTSFFRDAAAFEALKEQVFPHIMQKRAPEAPIRIWVPGCSSGEEAYSVAIVLIEHLGDEAATTQIQIFGTDVDARAVDKARLGVYPEGICSDVAHTRLKRFFVKIPEGYQITKSIRDMCVFAVQNVIKDPPFSKLDLVCCRNLLIYLGPVLQKKVLQTFHYALKPTGFLLLGNSETIGSHAELFQMADRRNKIYVKEVLPTPVHCALDAPPFTPSELKKGKASVTQGHQPADVPQQADRLVLGRYAPPGVIINRAMDILHFRGYTGPYIAPMPGAATLNLLKFARQDLMLELRSVVHGAISERAARRKEGVMLRADGEQRSITIQVLPLEDQASGEDFYLVLFEEQPLHSPSADTPAGKKQKAEPNGDEQDRRIEELEHELLNTREYMQSIIEEQEATNEELKSASEETQSSNEELQSTNEELETAKEELQSINEELATVNEELENRNQELTRANNDLTNLLRSVNLAIVMLDEDLRIRHFTPQAQRLLNLIGSDIGRRITDIKPKFEVPDLGRMGLVVIETMSTQSVDIADEDGRFFKLVARPYRTGDNRIAGVVLTFIEVTDLKHSAELQRMAAVVRDSNDAVTVQDLKGRILAWNPRAERIYSYSEREALRMNIDDIVPEDRRGELQKAVTRLAKGESLMPFETERLSKDGSRVHVWLTASLLLDKDGKPRAIATTERKMD